MSEGWVMPEESIGTVLRDGLAYVRQAFTDGSIDELMGRIYRNVAPVRRAEIKAWLQDNEPSIIFSYPYDHAVVPCWAIVIDPEEQSQDYIGDDGAEDETEDGRQILISAERWQATVGVISHAENADLTRWLHQLAKFLIARSRSTLSDDYPYHRRLKARDLQPAKLPGEDSSRFCFRRVLSIELEFDQTDASEIEGITDDITEGSGAGTAYSPTDHEYPINA